MQSVEARTRRLRFVATLLLIAVICFTVLWSWLLLKAIVPAIFTDRIYDSFYVEAEAEVTLLMRVIVGALWFSILVFGWLASFFAAKVFWHIRSGLYFSDLTALAIKRLGLALILTMIADTIVGACAHSVLTWGNAPREEGVEGSVGYYPPSYFYDPGDITVLLCGLGFFLVGWLLQEGGRIEAENRGFI